ncbi:MAG: hypothetical protein QXJ12_01165 [Candidatus Parvarchaeota archaeon]|nr:hypothetical protein [Candidatus Parvarchaeota archaeon]
MKLNYSWYKVIYPDMEDLLIGEVYGSGENLIGKKIKISASAVKDVKQKFGYKIEFVITGIKDQSTCTADVDALIMTREWMSRMVRHNIHKIDIVVPVSIEGRPFKLKYICIISKANRRYSKLLMENISKLTADALKDYKLKDLIVDILNSKIQTEFHKKLNKIYPVRNFEIRMLEKAKASRSSVS